jgi:predicted TIM-barrel fold metal-dependent hydrolase
MIKLGGLGQANTGFPTICAEVPASSAELAAEWKPYIESCIEAFGADRCMFESNFPVDSGAGSYPVVWNAFKRIVGGASADEKAALFFDTAKRIYRLDV